MVNLRQYKYLYVDAKILQDDEAAALFYDLSQKHVMIKLIISDKEALEAITTFAFFAYVSEVLYGTDIIETVKQDVHHKKINRKRICLISDSAIKTVDMAYVGIGELYEYKTFADFYYAYHTFIKKLCWLLFLSLGCGMLYLILYLEQIIPVSGWAIDNDMTFFTLHIPLIYMLSMFLYGCRKRIFSFIDIFDLFV